MSAENFNPRPREEGDTEMRAIENPEGLFQSTPS